MPVAAKAVERVKIPEKAKVEFDDRLRFRVTGPNGKLERRLFHPAMSVTREGDEIVFAYELPQKRDKAMVGTLASHLRNMCTGVTDGFQYHMKVVYSHFPIKVTLKGKLVVIENFLGEKCPRRANLVGETKLLVKGNELTLLGPYVEDVGQSMANLERATRIKKRDPRVFQDGIYLVSRR
jgi:large subunit ribosomal protein L6